MLYGSVKPPCTDCGHDWKMETMGTRIRAARLDAKLTLAALGKKLGVSKAAVHNWEKGYNFPDLPVFMGICTTLKVSADFLLWDKAVPVYPPEVIELARRISRLDDAKKNLLVSIFTSQP